MFGFNRIDKLEARLNKLHSRIEMLERKLTEQQDGNEYRVYEDVTSWMVYRKCSSVTYTPKQMFDLLFDFLKIHPAYKESSISLEKKNGRP